MQIVRKTVTFSTSGNMDVVDLSSEIRDFLGEHDVVEGMLLIFAPGSTAGVSTIEFESGAVADLKRAMERLAPRDAEYEHNLRWGDGNGYAHVRSALMGPSLAVPVVDSVVATGTWQQIILCDFDNRPRERRVVFHLMS